MARDAAFRDNEPGMMPEPSRTAAVRLVAGSDAVDLSPLSKPP